MTAYLLDTNILSYLLDPASAKHARVRAALNAIRPHDDACVSVVSIYEIAFAAERSPIFADALPLIEAAFEVVGLPPGGARRFAGLKVALAGEWGAKPKALSRHNVDLMLAATALEAGMTIVSNDRVFAALATAAPDLVLLDWTR